MGNRYGRVVYETRDGHMEPVDEPAAPASSNFRIVSHHGARDWSPFGGLSEMLERAETLPAREDGYFKIVEG